MGTVNQHVCRRRRGAKVCVIPAHAGLTNYPLSITHNRRSV